MVALTDPPPVLADFLVVSSNSANLHPGDEIKTSSSVSLSKQEQLRVLNTETGETRFLIGPYNGPLSEYKAACRSEEQLDCGTLKRSNPLGATRGPRSDVQGE
jgi:hypothetical protein